MNALLPVECRGKPTNECKCLTPTEITENEALK